MAVLNWRTYIALDLQWGPRGGSASVNTGVWDQSLWDTDAARWASTEPNWITLDHCHIETASWTRGRTTLFGGPSPGTATFGLVYTGLPGTDWTWRHRVRIGDELRLVARAIKDGAWTAVLWRGDVRALVDQWSPDQTAHRVSVQCVGPLARWSVDLPEGPSVGADETMTQRINRIADLATFPRNRISVYRDQTAPEMRLQAGTFAQNLISELNSTLTSDTWDAWETRDGRIQAVDWGWWTRRGTGQPLVIWTNDGTLQQPHLVYACPTAFDTRVALDLVANIVTMSRRNGSAQTNTDPTSLALYGPQTWQYMDTRNRTNADVLAQVNRRLLLAANRIRTVERVQTEIATLGHAARRSAATADIGDRHQVYWDDGDTITDTDGWVHGLSHDISGDSWTATFQIYELPAV